MNKKAALVLSTLTILALLYAVYAADTTPPGIVLTAPANGSSTYVNKSNYSYTVSDSSPILWCRLKYGSVVQSITTSAAVNSTNTFYNINAPNGTINWTVECSDNETNVGSASSILYVLSDTTAPTIEINASASNVSPAGYANFSYTPLDMATGLKECRLYVDAAQKANTGVPKNNSENFFSDILLDPGIYTWRINCTDYAGNEGTSQPVIMSVKVEAIPTLTVEIIGPVDNYISNTRIFNFQYNPKSNDIVTFCGVYFNDSLNLSTTKVVANAVNNFSNIKLNEGNWVWSIECRTLGGIKKNSTARTAISRFEVLVSTFLNVTPHKPDDDSSDTIGVISFTFTPKSILAIKRCDLLTNNSVRATKETIAADTINVFPDIDLADGTWLWRIRCINDENKVVSSRTRTLMVKRAVQPEIEENLSQFESITDIEALREELPPTGREGASVKLLFFVILISTGLSFGVFVLSQEKYRSMIFKTVKPPRVYAKEQLKFYIDNHLKKGISEERIKRHLKKYNWSEKDIEKGFEEVYSEMRKAQRARKRPPLQPPPMPPKR